MAINPGDIISHAEMSIEEGVSLQKGMNFRIKGANTIILMSIRKGAPYQDTVLNDGKILIYEGHDVPKNIAKDPKSVDQPLKTPSGKLTENGKFFQSVQLFKERNQSPELVKVYEKIKAGIWVYNGIFELIDAWQEKIENRFVYKFKLQITAKTINEKAISLLSIKDLEHNRMIPTSVKLEVWRRDNGKCRKCGSIKNLHFDHILPFSKGGTSLKAENIQLLCAKHNLQKSDKII